MIALHARRVLVGDEEIEDGWVTIANETIVSAGAEPERGAAVVELGDCDLIPGLVDLHSDCLDQKVHPRPSMDVPVSSALLDLDTEVAAHGITTHLLCVSLDHDLSRHRTAANAVATLEALEAVRPLLRADHRVHLRVDVAIADLDSARRLAAYPEVALLSYMDHTPGQGQYADETHFRRFYANYGHDKTELDQLIARKRAGQASADEARAAVAAIARENRAALASHDDDSVDSVSRADRLGATISEFPVTLAAALSATARGLGTVMGAPNARRGRSHVDNLSARQAVNEGCLTALASDYHPPSLLAAIYELARDGVCTWAAGVAMASAAPARLVGLSDRGQIRPGLRADLVAVGQTGGQPVVRQTWVGGRAVLGLGALQLVG